MERFVRCGYRAVFSVIGDTTYSKTPELAIAHAAELPRGMDIGRSCGRRELEEEVGLTVERRLSARGRARRQDRAQPVSGRRQRSIARVHDLRRQGENLRAEYESAGPGPVQIDLEADAAPGPFQVDDTAGIAGGVTGAPMWVRIRSITCSVAPAGPADAVTARRKLSPA